MPLRSFVTIICALLFAISSSGKGTDTFRVHFPFNDGRLGKTAEEHIDQLIFKDILIHGQKLIVLAMRTMWVTAPTTKTSPLPGPIT